VLLPLAVPLPEGVPRVDALPESFVQLLSHRPHMPGDAATATKGNAPANALPPAR